MSFLTMKNLKISPYLLLAFVLLGFRFYTKLRPAGFFEDADDAKFAVCEVVDLGLPSGTLWADRNIGSESEGDFGWYFAWGEVTPKYIYNFVSYQYAVDSIKTISKYQIPDGKLKNCWYEPTGERDRHSLEIYRFTGDGKTRLENTDDAAYVNWGGDWRMPTNEQIDELCSKCKWTWGRSHGEKRNYGFYVEGPNGNTIFLPMAGRRTGDKFNGVSDFGYYWSSDIYSGSSFYACGLYFIHGYMSSDVCYPYYFYRTYGFPVRPVCSPN